VPSDYENVALLLQFMTVVSGMTLMLNGPSQSVANKPGENI